MEDTCKCNASLLAICGPPHEMCVCVGQAEEVHLGPTLAPMLQQVRLGEWHLLRLGARTLKASQCPVLNLRGAQMVRAKGHQGTAYSPYFKGYGAAPHLSEGCQKLLQRAVP